ncbi:acetyl-CoA C-acyltransferase [Bacillus sp. AGMB 02131]|uniref:Acetyl-CoA C-acyltransferase n=1 Tax=Peribacillus faecalis TaxID=2772559 RepID=A0A927CTL0_9BACI|nr:acetyl-CoA C-acyltransferase [Peribacillus faecalis]MBD3107206.1 acetyl-CoA C-acyltransferase [Peribacillus faecalis]
MEAYIFNTVRTPRGAFRKGSLKDVAPIELLLPLLQRLREDSRLIDKVNDVILGCVTQTNLQGANIAKTALLVAGYPESVPGMTVNRYCTSGLDAILLAAAKVNSGIGDFVLAGGVESCSLVPMFSDHGPWFADPVISEKTKFIPIGLSADLMASNNDYSRQQLDEYACHSHERAASATKQGCFLKSMVSLPSLSEDECIRLGMTVESMEHLSSTFNEDKRQMWESRIQPFGKGIIHYHHPGNSPVLADGAALLPISGKRAGEEAGLKPRARIVHAVNVSTDPLLLNGGEEATIRLLKEVNRSPDEIDLFEVYEAYAATVLQYKEKFDIPIEKLNTNGGVIAMGHALGATGAMMTMTLLDELERRELKTGIVAMSGGAGVGTAMLIERV